MKKNSAKAKKTEQIRPRDIKSLEQLRDEMKVQAHLFKAELKEEWQRLEGDWRKLRALYSPAERATRKSATELKAASAGLIKTIKEGYERVRDSMPGKVA